MYLYNIYNSFFKCICLWDFKDLTHLNVQFNQVIFVNNIWLIVTLILFTSPAGIPPPHPFLRHLK